jgi:CheY-like chemotaxis protein
VNDENHLETSAKARSLARKEPDAQSRSPHGRVLIIDDCQELLSIHCTMLEIAGFETEGHGSGFEALQRLSGADKPDLIILDYCLGDMSGLEFIEQLERERPDITNDVPVLYLTGVDNIQRGKAAGLLQKPTTMNQLIETVHHYVGQARNRTKTTP